MPQLKGRPRKRHKKQAQLQRSIGHHKSLFAPIRRLPPELLSEIFMHCLSAYGVRPSIREAPLLLLRVNARWRDVAFRTPQLWATLVIGGNTSPDLLCTWLSRSGSCPLDITIDDQFAALSRSPFQAMASSDLVALCRRFRSLTIRIEELYTDGKLLEDGPLFGDVPVEMPFLEKLCVHACDTSLEEYGIIPFVSAPRLHHCDFSHWDDLSQHMPLQWSQLTNLALSGQHEILEILRQCTNLVALELRCCDLYHNDDDKPTYPLLLPHLTAFDFRWASPTSEIITFFDLPSLQKLKISINEGEGRLYLPQRCAGQITELKLNCVHGLSPEEVENCLVRMPELRHLDSDHPDTVCMLSRSVPPNGRCLLPKLRSIVTHSRSRLADMVDLIKGRWNPYSHDAQSDSLRDIRAPPAKSEAPNPETLVFLRRCVDEGLRLHYGAWHDGVKHEAGVWPVRSGDEESGRKEFGWTYPCEESESGMD